MKAIHCLAMAAMVYAIHASQAEARNRELPKTYCVHYDATERRITNTCSEDLEVYWQDSHGWSQATIKANSWFPYHGGDSYGPTNFAACALGQSHEGGLCFSY